MKLKCTVRVRMFEGTDWPLPERADEEEEDDADASIAAAAKTNAPAALASRSGTASTRTNDVNGGASRKAVSFRSEELLRDLTQPQKKLHRHHASDRVNKSISNNSRSSAHSRHRHSTTVDEVDEDAYYNQQLRNIVDITAKDLLLCIRLYEQPSLDEHISAAAAASATQSSKAPSRTSSLPTQRISVSAQDFLISFGSLRGPRKKVLGYWKSLKMPRDIHEPMLQMVLLSYSDDEEAAASGGPSTEYRLYLTLLPLRCYLSDELISFIKNISKVLSNKSKKEQYSSAIKHSSVATDEVASQAATIGKTPGSGAAVGPTNEPAESLYFQYVSIAPVQMKIDYIASGLNFQALQAGDYSQLLNIFPLDGLEITLKEIRLNGAQGLGACLNSMLEAWVHDIYANQLHRVVSGTAPFRGLSNIGSDLQELLTIPMNDFRRNGGTITQLRRGTKSLLRTVAREAFHASHKFTMFVANTITELTSDDVVVPPTQRHAQQSGQHRMGATAAADSLVRAHSVIPALDTDASRNWQPHGVLDGLNRARSSIAREVNAAAETVIAIPVRQNVRTTSGAGKNTVLKSVIRAVPIAILRPVAGIAEGISYTMLGLRNDIDPGARIDEEDQWNVDIIEQQFPEITKNTTTSRTTRTQY